MDINKPKLAVLATIAGGVAFAGGYAAGVAVPPSEAADRPAPAKPVAAVMDPMIVPVWGQGRITGFVAVEMSLELAPGSDKALLLPPIRDRLLADLYEIGAQGGMQPGTVDPVALRERLLRAAAEASDSSTRNLLLTRLILQENRRKPA